MRDFTLKNRLSTKELQGILNQGGLKISLSSVRRYENKEREPKYSIGLKIIQIMDNYIKKEDYEYTGNKESPKIGYN